MNIIFVYLQKFSGYARLKVLAVNGKKMFVVSKDFFHRKSSELKVSNLALLCKIIFDLFYKPLKR